MSSSVVLLPRQKRVLVSLGENIKLARLRRRLTAQQVAERAGISRSTLYHLEKGSANSSIGTLLRTLSVLGLDGDLAMLGQDDELGRKLQDAQIKTPKKRAPRRKNSKADS